MIPLFKPYMPELQELESILYSGKLAYGTQAREFEGRLQEFFATSRVLVTSSFNLAISVVLSALGLAHGDEVIASPMGCLASTQPYVTHGLRVRWADVDPKTGTLAPDSVSSRLTPATKAIVHNHYCGYPGFVDEINAVGQERGIPVIDDGIECFGSEYQGRKIGVTGADATVFSLTPVRLCNCIEGGVAIFKERDTYERALLIRDCGIDRAHFRDSRGEIDPAQDISLPGFSATMSNVNGYIGMKQMEEVDTLINLQRENATRWDRFFLRHGHCVPIQREYCEPNYWVYGVLSDNKFATIDEFRRQGYYASGVHVRNDSYSVFEPSGVPLRGVDEFSSRFVALPCGWWMQ